MIESRLERGARVYGNVSIPSTRLGEFWVRGNTAQQGQPMRSGQFQQHVDNKLPL